MTGGPESPPFSVLASKKRETEKVLQGNAIIRVANSPAVAFDSSSEYLASLSKSCIQPPPFSPSLSTWTTRGQPADCMAAESPSDLAYGPEKRFRKVSRIRSNVDGPETNELVPSGWSESSGTGASSDAECDMEVRGRCRRSGVAQSKYSSLTSTLEEVTTLPLTSTSYPPFELRERPRNEPTQPRPLRLGLC